MCHMCCVTHCYISQHSPGVAPGSGVLGLHLLHDPDISVKWGNVVSLSSLMWREQ